MKLINIVFFSVLLFWGCGVMNNPKSKNPQEDDASMKNEVTFTAVSKIDSKPLLGSNNIEILNNYKIFETKEDADIFLADLNSSYGDIPVVHEWITNIENAHISYSTENLLFYPILQSSYCGRKDSIDIKGSDVTIALSRTLEDCDQTFVYHVLIYQIPKDIQNITIKAFKKAPVTILNKKN